MPITQLETSHWLSVGQITSLLASLRRDDLDKILIGIMNLREPGDMFEIGTHTWWMSGGPSGELSVRVTKHHSPQWMAEENALGYDILLRTDKRVAVAAMSATIWSCWGCTTPLIVDGGEAQQAFCVAYHFLDHPLKGVLIHS